MAVGGGGSTKEWLWLLLLREIQQEDRTLALLEMFVDYNKASFIIAQFICSLAAVCSWQWEVGYSTSSLA